MLFVKYTKKVLKSLYILIPKKVFGPFERNKGFKLSYGTALYL